MPARHDNRVVLHVVSYDVSRGAERYARALVDSLNSRHGDEHLLMTIFRGDESLLGADIELDVPRGALRRGGFDPRALSRMRKVIQERRPNAVIAHGGEPAKYAAFACGQIPYVYLVIGSSHPRLGNFLRRALRRVYLRRASAVVAVSTDLADEVRGELEDGGARVHVIPNGRDPGVYRPGEVAVDRPPHVLLVGHLDEQKRPLLFVEVMRAIAERGVPATAAIVGGGPLLEAVRQESAGLSIDVLGPRDDVPELLAHADVLALTSQPPEGMPGVLIEAGLAGLPCVSTDVPGARDVVIDGVTGKVVDVDDETGLVDALQSLLVDPRTRHQMGAAARDRCVQEFSLQASAGAWELLLEEMEA